MGAGGAYHRQSISMSPTAKSFIPFFLPFFLPSSLSLHFFLPSFLSLCLPAVLLIFLPSGVPQSTHTINPPSLHGPAAQLASRSVTTDEVASLYSFYSEYNGPSSPRSTAALSQRHGLGHLLKK